MARRIHHRKLTGAGLNFHPTKRGPGRKHGQGRPHGRPHDPFAFARVVAEFQRLSAGFDAIRALAQQTQKREEQTNG